ncbi:MAG: butyrate kinase [Thermodesulfobacteriota bacterium]
MNARILAINPGSTSTKAAVFEDGRLAAETSIEHSALELASFRGVMGQLSWRMRALCEAMDLSGRFDAVVGRGGFLAPVPGGVYAVGTAMLDELSRAAHGEHASNLGAFMAMEVARENGCPALVVDPVATDELMDAARMTGLPEISRRSIFHALGQRGAAREAARRLGIDYGHGRFIVAFLGGGISVGAHLKGRVVDVTNALDGEGPFSPERSGALPLLPVLDLLERGVHSPAELRSIVTSRAGLSAHLGCGDLRRCEEFMAAGDGKAARVFEALAYNVAKAVASMAPALEGRVEAVVYAGGMARSTRLTHELTKLTAFLGPVVVVTGLEELEAMARGAMLALEGKLPVQKYPPPGPGENG